VAQFISCAVRALHSFHLIQWWLH